MSDDKAKAVRALSLSDEEYFDFDEERQASMQSALAEICESDTLDDEGEPESLLVLSAPTIVDLDKAASVPVILGNAQTGMRAWRINFRPNLHLFLRNLATGELSVSQPFVDMRRGGPELVSGGGEPPDRLIAHSMYSSVEQIDLRNKLGEHIARGPFAVTAVCNELSSNTALLQVEGKATRKPGTLAATLPGGQHRLDARPALDRKIDVPKSASAGGSTDFIVRVEIQLSEMAGIVRPSSEQPLWPCHLIMVRVDRSPTIVPLVVPVRRVSTAEGKTAFNASFDVNLRSILASHEKGLYQLYLDAGTAFCGPHSFTMTK